MRSILHAAAVVGTLSIAGCGAERPSPAPTIATPSAELRPARTPSYQPYTLATVDGDSLTGSAFEAAIMCKPDSDAVVKVLNRLVTLNRLLGATVFAGKLADGKPTEVVLVTDEHATGTHLMVGDSVVVDCRTT
jgi:hypothetical protein